MNLLNPSSSGPTTLMATPSTSPNGSARSTPSAAATTSFKSTPTTPRSPGREQSPHPRGAPRTHLHQGTVREYSSGRVRTKYRGDWTYGRFEIRAKIPEGRGLWPAIWMMPTDDHYGTWAASGEIDIMENKGHQPRTVTGTLHSAAHGPPTSSCITRFAGICGVQVQR